MQAIQSSSARSRLRAARAFAAQFPPDAELLIVAATRGAADDFARAMALDRATFGLHRFSLTELAARAAALPISAAGQVAGTAANAEAMAARAAFDALRGGELAYFAPVAEMPGFPRALTRTLHELRLAGVAPPALVSAATQTDALTDLARLLERVDDQLRSASIADRAALFATAADAWPAARWAGCPLLILDVPLASAAECRFALSIGRRSASALLTVAAGDDATTAALEAAGVAVASVDDDAGPESDLGRLRRYIFMLLPPPPRARTGGVSLFSAPGEAREALEIARRALDEAEAGVRFDEMAVCLRSPGQYVGLVEHAFERAGVPAYFDRGTRRPNPTGRAFIALLSCACEKLSAKRFDEYLSLGEVPRLDAQPVPRDITPDDEVYARFSGGSGDSADPSSSADAAPPDSEDEAIVAGALRAPWKWEELIVESAVIGGTDRAQGKQRWRRRLDGLAAEYRLRLSELEREEPDSPRRAALLRDQRNLRHLRAFALPIIDTLGAWPQAATWGEWLNRLTELAPRVLRRPRRVLRVLADLRPMASIGPVPLEEVRDLLQTRLLMLDWDPPARRYGSVFVGTPHQIRGRTFKVVFVPGLAERVFPQRVREDPLLPDAARRSAGAGLVTRNDRTSAERLLLRLAIGAATDRLYLSYPRLGAEMGDMRPRVPSFYALDVMRAMTGRVPDHRTLAVEAAEAANASLAWPAPSDPARAVDDLEHDLATLAPLLEARDVAAVKGHARYLLELNPALRRSVSSRWARAHRRWSTSDGLIQVTAATERALARNRLRSRPYSLSALQRFAACPYQFLLAAIHRLAPWEEPEPLVRLDPLTRGSLFHRAQAEFLRELQAAGSLPVTPSNLPDAIRALHLVVDRVAAAYADDLAPAIERVWKDEIGDIRRDLGIWAGRLAQESGWIPEYFEFSFGLRDQGRDPRSLPEPVVLEQGFILRGSVDLIERRADGSALRVTDHKTGRNRSNPDLVIGGGAVLQPVLYSMAIERGLGARVSHGRLYYCTTAGGFSERAIAINEYARAQGVLALTIVDRAIELGRLPAAPARDGCRFCDFRPVCGPDEEQRVAKKPDTLVSDLLELRGLR
ncbi:MAG TPA: PD-(D/E)XK nuclease family protein [Vicinamibacterales bacterium]|nr:PD-(D/E)XK nuclease family protein [Vicinamibacterales bacterium]